MRYATAAAFRAALEDRLNRLAALPPASSPVRLRKLVVFDRFLARLVVVAPERWVVKGGVALVLRLGNQARTTMDIDFARVGDDAVATEDLLAATESDLGDHFHFAITRLGGVSGLPEGAAVRYHVRAELAGRRFEEVNLDIGVGPPLAQPPDRLLGPDLLDFAGLSRIAILVLPLEQHLAEKVHAYTHTYGDGRANTRVKDFIDIVIIRSRSVIRAGRLRSALMRTFAARGTTDLPVVLPVPPPGWAVPYRVLARQVGIAHDVMVGYRLAADLLDPVLRVAIDESQIWDPVVGRW